MKLRLQFCWVLCCFLCHFVVAQTPAEENGASVLLYNLYASDAAMPFRENTRLTFTNTSETEAVTLHLFLIANDCQVADLFLALTANQTATVLASDLDPGTKGFLLALAVNRVTGCPIKFNHLIGDAAIKLATGHRAMLPAEGIRALRENPVRCDAAGNAAELLFEGIRYESLPRALVIDSVGSRLDANSTLIVINRISGDLRERAATTGVLFGILRDDEGGGISFQMAGNCQIFKPLFPLRVTAGPAELIAMGHTAWCWMVSTSSEAVALAGAVLNYNANEGLLPAAFSGGRNMHHFTYLPISALTVPVMPPQ